MNETLFAQHGNNDSKYSEQDSKQWRSQESELGEGLVVTSQTRQEPLLGLG